MQHQLIKSNKADYMTKDFVMFKESELIKLGNSNDPFLKNIQ